MSRGDEVAQVGDTFLFVCSQLVMAIAVCSGVQGNFEDNVPRRVMSTRPSFRTLRRALFLLHSEAYHISTAKCRRFI